MLSLHEAAQGDDALRTLGSSLQVLDRLLQLLARQLGQQGGPDGLLPKLREILGKIQIAVGALEALNALDLANFEHAVQAVDILVGAVNEGADLEVELPPLAVLFLAGAIVAMATFAGGDKDEERFPILRRNKLKKAVQDRLEELERDDPPPRKLHQHDFSTYKNITEPKLPDGDYMDIYITDHKGDGRRLVIDRNTGTTYLTTIHYQSWTIIEDPWKHGGPKF